MKNPKLKAWLWFAVNFGLIALALFLSAGTLQYWRAWIFLAVVAVSSVPLTIYISDNPLLLDNRTKAGPIAEQRPIQKIIVLCLTVAVVAAFVVAGSTAASAGPMFRDGSPPQGTS